MGVFNIHFGVLCASDLFHIVVSTERMMEFFIQNLVLD